MRLSRPRQLAEAPFDLTPMIDVVLLLIIFFMLSAQFAETLGTRLDLPKEKGQATRVAEHSIVIDLKRDGTLVLSGRTVAADRLMLLVSADIRTFTAKKQNWEVVVRADRACPAAHLNQLAAALSNAGVRNWKLATEGGGA